MTHLPRLIAVVGPNDLGNDRMPHDILRFQGVKTYFFDILQYPVGLAQTGLIGVGQVNLSKVACHHRLGPKTDASEEHLHLLRRGVLRFIQNDEGIVQSASAHVGKGGNLNDALFQMSLRQK